MKILKVFGVSLVIITILVLVLYFVFMKPTNDVSLESRIKRDTISFGEIGKAVFFQAKTWGVSGNHEEIILSSSPISENYLFVKEKDKFTVPLLNSFTLKKHSLNTARIALVEIILQTLVWQNISSPRYLQWFCAFC